MADEMVQIIMNEMLENLERRDMRIYRERGNPLYDLSEKQFVKLFRLSKELVRFLINRISDYIVPSQRPQDLDITTKVSK